jgi:hypothetical protein
MVDLTLRIWHAVTTTDLFSSLQQKTLCIFKETLSQKEKRLRLAGNFGCVALRALVVRDKFPHNETSHRNAQGIQPYAYHGHSPFSLRMTNTAPIMEMRAETIREGVLVSGMMTAEASRAAEAA